jgi:RimJ/RimL family protein N-acetyltransferase
MTAQPKLSIFSRDDIAARCQALNAPESIAGLSISTPVSLGSTSDWYERVKNNKSRRDFVLKSGGVVLGFLGLPNIDDINGTAELYVFMSPGHSGKGHGRDLLSLALSFAKIELKLRKIFLYVTEGNDRAIAFYEKAGFVLEGRLSKHAWHRGSYRDRLIYSIFLDRYSAMSPDQLYGRLA